MRIPGPGRKLIEAIGSVLLVRIDRTLRRGKVNEPYPIQRILPECSAHQLHEIDNWLTKDVYLE